MVTFLQSTVSVFYKYFITTSIYGMFERPPFPNHFILFFFSWKRPFLVRYFITSAWSHGPNSLSAVIVYSIESLKNCFDGDKNGENCKNVEKMEDYLYTNRVWSSTPHYQSIKKHHGHKSYGKHVFYWLDSI